MICRHTNFNTRVKINRVMVGTIEVGFSLYFRIRCSDCDREFKFLGCPVGVSDEGPTVSEDAAELRVPVELVDMLKQ